MASINGKIICRLNGAQTWTPTGKAQAYIFQIHNDIELLYGISTCPDTDNQNNLLLSQLETLRLHVNQLYSWVKETE